MSHVLKGNFTPARDVRVDEPVDDLSSQFEREALKKLGGSIAFVSKRKFLFGADEPAAGRLDKPSKE
jgi:hypothetical protein